MTALALALALPVLARAAAAPEVRRQARAYQPGEAVLVIATDQKPGVAPTGSFAGEELSFFPASSSGTYLALAAIDLDVPPGPAHLIVDLTSAGGTSRHSDEVVKILPKSFRVRHVTVPPQYVKPNRQDELRAEKEEALLKGLFAQATTQRFFAGDFVSPIPGAVVSRFGERSVFNGVPKSPHSGADLHAAEGAPVKAPAGGKVVLARELYYCGNTVLLDHGYGVHTVYCHLSKLYAQEGQVVAPGDVLGLVGHTGRAEGPHLHWGLKLGATGRVDPFSLTSLDLASALK